MNKRIKKFKIRYLILLLLILVVIAVTIFMRFGGFSTGESANSEEFAKYAKTVDEITIPEDSKIIALGEASHGNVEFQKLKLDVFKQMVEEYNVRAFVIEGDYGGSERVNRYIHNGEGTAEKAVEAIDFAIYRTDEMTELISYMREYNESTVEGEDLRFYGLDMQRPFYSFQLLNESATELGVNVKGLEDLMVKKDWNSKYDYDSRVEIIKKVKNELKTKENSDYVIHFADMLLQYSELEILESSEGSSLRDQFMAENVEWILEQEEGREHERIFVSGHNSHLAKWGSFDSMGKLLSNNPKSNYYVIGTDFYRTKNNMPASSKKRTNQVFYSHDPLAKASKMAGLETSWLDFSSVPEESDLGKSLLEYTYMGNLGENYSWFMRLLPPSYRMFQPPAVLYDSMIFVTDANPTKIKTK